MGNLVAAGGYQEVLIWDVTNGALLKRLGTGQLADTISAVVFSADGSLLAVAEGVPYGAGAVKLLDVASGAVVAAFLEPQDATLCLALSPDGKWLAGAGVDGVVRVWSMDEKKLARRCGGMRAGCAVSRSARTANSWPAQDTTAPRWCGRSGRGTASPNCGRTTRCWAWHSARTRSSWYWPSPVPTTRSCV